MIASRPPALGATPRAAWLGWGILGVLVAMALWRLFGWRAEVAGASAPWETVLRLRTGAATTAALAGAALGLSGLMLQSLLRNPLASPFILGLSSGAGLGVAVATWLAWAGAAVMLPVGRVIPASVGALAVLGCVFALGRRRGGLDPLTLVLAGVCVSSICAAVGLAFESLIPPAARAPLTSWLMGQVSEIPNPTQLWVTGLVLCGGATRGWMLGRAMDVASFSDDEAKSMGVDLAALRRELFIWAGLCTGAAVALCGPIAFVGFVAPHLARMLWGAHHRALVLGAMTCGALVLLAADGLRQAVDLGAGRLPVGVVTALAGGPAFLILLRRARLSEAER